MVSDVNLHPYNKDETEEQGKKDAEKAEEAEDTEVRRYCSKLLTLAC